MNSPVNQARLRLLALWIAVIAHTLAESSVRTYAIFKNRGWRESEFGFLFILLGFSAAPAFALAPLIGAAASSRWCWQVMVVSVVAGLSAVGWSSYQEYLDGKAPWAACLGALAVESTLFAVCCFAIVPQAAQTGRLSLPQLNGVFAVAIGAGMFGGLWLGIERFPHALRGMPPPLRVALICLGGSLVFVLFARFDALNPPRINDGLIKPFAQTALAIARDRCGRNSLLALWGIFAIGLAVTQWMMPIAPQARYEFFLALIIGTAVGGLHFHPFRTVGIVPYAMAGITASGVWAVAAENWYAPSLGIGACIGMMIAPLITTYQIHQPDDRRGHGGALLFAGCALITGGFLAFLLVFVSNPQPSRRLVAFGILGVSIIGLGFSWVVFFRAAVEMFLEGFLWPFYRIRAIGPGAHTMPLKGPALVIANHAAWFDPIWLTKIVPFAPTPFMTSKFFDLPVIGWFVRKVMGAIRVPDVTIRKEAPEIAEVLAALDRGECVFVFPEGWLRRKEEQQLRRFGRGIWQVLTARPNIPIIACWIEGGWGSYVSYKNGPPMKNKKIDFWRHIDIGVLDPFKIDAATLEKHMMTRTALMKKVMEARALLGLPQFDPFSIPIHDDAEGEKLVDGGPEGAK